MPQLSSNNWFFFYILIFNFLFLFMINLNYLNSLANYLVMNNISYKLFYYNVSY